MSSFLRFSTSAEIVKVPADALVFVKADGNYSTIVMADRSDYVLTLQLGQIERLIAEGVDEGDFRFIRIGKSLIVNRAYITYINVPRQKMVLSDCRSFRHEVSASREALKAMKDFLEKEND